MPTADWPALLTQSRAAAYLGWSLAKWYRVRGADGLPAPVRVPGSSRPHWRRADLDDYIRRLPKHRSKGKRPGKTEAESPPEVSPAP